MNEQNVLPPSDGAVFADSDVPMANRYAHKSLRRIFIAMVLSVGAVAALAVWDEEREARQALESFAEEQALLAKSVASELALRLAVARQENAPSAADHHESSLLTGAAFFERPNALVLLLLPPSGDEFRTSDGRFVRSDALRDAMAKGKFSLPLTRPDAAALGLPERTAWAGLARVDGGSLGRWGIAVVATAQRERDREIHGRWRLVLGVGLVASLVLGFGGLALRKQRRQLELIHQLHVADVRRQGDERLERAQQIAVLGTLAAGIAHELATPLGVIVGRAEQLQPQLANNERSHKAIRAILAQTERIHQVIRGFLDLARGGRGSFADHPPAHLLTEAADLVAHRFEKAGVHLVRIVARDLPAFRCDARLLEQALVNLLLNACDASSPGQTVTLQLLHEDDRVVFVIADPGVGIRPADIARAKEPFFTTKPLGEGTGLGLAITHEIARLHRGTLTLTSRPAGGTEATLQLPASHENAPRRPMPSPPKEPHENDAA